MEAKQIDSIHLENGLTLKIYDDSRKLSADRWAVKLVVCLQIEISEQWFTEHVPSPAPLEQLFTKLGHTLEYTSQMGRNFVDAGDKGTVIEDLHTRVLANVKYYSHPDFAARFIIAEFKKPVY